MRVITISECDNCVHGNVCKHRQTIEGYLKTVTGSAEQYHSPDDMITIKAECREFWLKSSKK